MRPPKQRRELRRVAEGFALGFALNIFAFLVFAKGTERQTPESRDMHFGAILGMVAQDLAAIVFVLWRVWVSWDL